nr:putative reverse transcriptase domain-containing protein [Tanacetum cinerariifolium]
KTGLGYDGHVNESEVLNNVVDSCESDGDDNQVNDRFKKIRSSAPIIEDWESDSVDENVFEHKEVKKTVKPSLEKIKFVNARNTTVENENKAEKPRKFSQSPKAASVSTARRINTAASRPHVNNALPITYSYFNAHSPVSSWKGVIRFGKRGKLSPRYVGPFKIIDRVGPVAYKLEVEIMDLEVKELKQSQIHIVKHKANMKNRAPERRSRKEERM